MASVERKLNECIARLEALAGQVQAVSQAVADIQAFLTAGSDEEALKDATQKLKLSTDLLRASVEANQPKP